MSCYLGMANVAEYKPSASPTKLRKAISPLNAQYKYQPGDSMLSFASRNSSVGVSVAARQALHHAYDVLHAENEARVVEAKEEANRMKREAIQNTFTMKSLRKPWPAQNYQPLIYDTCLPSPHELEAANALVGGPKRQHR